MTEPAAAAADAYSGHSVRALKDLLASVGVSFVGVSEKSELLSLVRAYPHPFPSAAPAAGAAAASPAEQAAALLASHASPAAQVAALRALRGPPAVRRDVTARVHASRLAAWRQSPRFVGMARHLVDDIHAHFRQGFVAVLDESQRRGAVATAAFRRAADSLHGHHSIEDSSWFPRLRRLHPDLDAEVDALEADHAEHVTLETRVAKGDLAALSEMVAALDDHLNREELLTVQFLLDGSGGM